MTLSEQFLQRGLFLFDANISTRQVEVSDNFKLLLGLKSNVVPFEESGKYFEYSTKESVYNSFLSSTIGTTWNLHMMTVNGLSWHRFEITNRFTDNIGHHHAIGTGRELSNNEIENQQLNSNFDIRLILSIINDLQITTSDKLFSKGIRHVLQTLNTNLPHFNIAILKYVDINSFDIIDIAKCNFIDKHNEILTIDSTIKSVLISQCFFSKKPLKIENIDDYTDIPSLEKNFFYINNFKSALLIPIVLPTEVPWGVIAITNTRHTTWSKIEIEYVTVLANTIAACIRRNQLNTSLHEQIKQQHLACQVGKIDTWHWDCNTQSTSNYIFTENGNVTPIIADIDMIYERANSDDMNTFKKEMKLINSGKKDSFRINFRHRSYVSNKTEWYDVIGEVLRRDANGKPLAMAGIARNINEEKKTELAKEAEIEHQRNIYNNIPVGIEFFDSTGLITYSNNTMEKLFGVQISLVKKNNYNIFDHTLWTKEQKAMIRNNDNCDIITRYDFYQQPFAPKYFTSRNDTTYFIHKISKLYNQGKFKGYMSVTIDTTETYIQKEQIRIFESYLSEIGLFAKLGVFWDNNSSIYTSEQWNINLGLPRNRKATFYDHDIDNVHLEDREKIESQYKALTEGYIQSFQQDVRVLQFDGKLHWIRIFFTRNDNNETTGLSIEITQRKQNEQHLIKAKQKAERMDMLKSAFINNMSHEIRTPLNAIVGFSELLVMADTEEERNLHADIIKTNNEHLLLLINDILDYSKLESNNMEYKYKETDINKLSKEIFLDNASKCPSDVIYTIRPSDYKLVTFVDPKRTAQIITNLINNAFKFTSKGSVEVWWEHDESEMSFHVKDTGIGIAEKDLQRIFDSFVKLDNFTIGTGLGLSICNTMAQQMGGKIKLTSSENNGSHFWLTLPILNETEYNKMQIVSDRKEIKTAIIASNDQDTLDFMSYCLDENETIHYTRTEGFFPMWLEKKPWLTVLDVHMFGQNIIEYLPGLRHHSNSNVILVLNYHQSGISNEILLNVGATATIMMPTSIEEVKEIINMY